MTKMDDLVNQMTTEEKAALLEGTDSWYTNAIPRLGIPQLHLTDGPHGLRKVRSASGGFAVTDNEPATAFPTSAAVAASWNPELARGMGEAIAEECIDAGVDVLLAPGINIKRSPLCGRNFEYYSEDPLVSGKFATAFVQGVQSKGVGCSVKHYAANSNENFRFVGDSVVDERALREIYLRAFESVVKEAKPYSVMCSYNRINGTFASQNHRLLTGILREEWGFDGVVMTDWGATCDRVEGLLAGCDLDMPGGVWHNRKSIIEAARSGKLPPHVLDESVKRMLNLINRCKGDKPESGSNLEKHAELSCAIAKEGAILLKNDGTLPLTGSENLLIVGEMFEKMRFQGAGSSLVNPAGVMTPKDAFDRRGISYTYEKGYRCFYPERDIRLEQAAIHAASGADTILFFGGLTDFEESEGFDREHMRLGESQTELLQALLSSGKKVVLVLFAGAPVELPFFDGLSALLNMVLPGMYGGEATAALLFGEATPSGKLTESWPKRPEDTSCYADYNRSSVSRYYESIYVGYRAYDKAGTELQFPFGYGLSYTTFQYANMTVHEHDSQIVVAADISNTGQRAGAEVVQLYVRHRNSSVFRPDKELCAFTKVDLLPGESKRVELSFDRADLSFWHAKWSRRVLENGQYELMLAASATDVRLTSVLSVMDGEEVENPYTDEVSKAYAMPPRQVPSSFADLAGYRATEKPSRAPLTLESQLRAFRRSLAGRVFHAAVMFAVRKDYKKAWKMPDSLERDTQLKNAHFLYRMMPYNSIRSMCMSSSGQFSYRTAAGIVELANGRWLRGMSLLLSKEEPLPLPKQSAREGVDE